MTAAATAGFGDLDTRFGMGGPVQVAGNAGANVLQLPDRRILLIGPPTWHQGSAVADRAVAINRYLAASGQPDTSFGQDGRVTVALPVDHPTISAVALQPDGHVVLAGSYWAGGGQPFVARVDRNGALDRSFGSDGISDPGTGLQPVVTRSVPVPGNQAHRTFLSVTPHQSAHLTCRQG